MDIGGLLPLVRRSLYVFLTLQQHSTLDMSTAFRFFKCSLCCWSKSEKIFPTHLSCFL